MHLLDLALSVREGVEKQPLKGYRFNTIGVSDGMSMGTTGMRYSLQSRDVIADSIETTMSAQWYGRRTRARRGRRPGKEAGRGRGPEGRAKSWLRGGS